MTKPRLLRQLAQIVGSRDLFYSDDSGWTQIFTKAERQGIARTLNEIAAPDPARVSSPEEGTAIGSARETLLAERVASLSSQLAGLRTALESVRDEIDPYAGFEGNGEACRFCFARRWSPHNNCIWQRAAAALAVSQEPDTTTTPR